MEFYSEQDLQDNAAQLRRALLRLVLPTLALLAALIATLRARVQWATVLVTVLEGALWIFAWDMRIAPVRAYRRHLNELLHGLRRGAEGVVVSLSEDASYRAGVLFSTLILNVDPKLDPKGERLFYVDRCKPKPALVPGDFAQVTANGNFLTAWEK